MIPRCSIAVSHANPALRRGTGKTLAMPSCRESVAVQQRLGQDNNCIETEQSQPGGRHGRHCETDAEGAAGERPLCHRRNPAARPRAGKDARLGDPQGAPRSAGNLDADRSAADLDHRRRRGARSRDGGRRQLQRRMGGLGPADFGSRRSQESVPHRGLRRLRNRLGDRRQGEALEGRRRGHRPLQSGRRRRRGMQRRRSDVFAPRSASGATRRRTARSRNSAACSRGN